MITWFCGIVMLFSVTCFCVFVRLLVCRWIW